VKNLPFHHRLRFALAGIASAFKTEASFRFQSLAALGALGTLAVLRAPPFWWATFILLIASILSAELFNTALESVVDKLHPEMDPAIRIAKDCAAAAVLVLSLAALVIFAAFLIERFL
jgi:undecaprenol kinase